MYARSNNSWKEYTGTNCYDNGHGAKTVPGPEPYAKAITFSACQEACSSDAKCSGIVTSVYGPAPPPPTPPPPGGIPWNPGEQIAGPTDPQDYQQWISAMRSWRAAARNSSWYTGAAYEDPQLTWTQTAYIQPQMHPYERYFFDPTIGKSGNYTVQRWIDDVNDRYGGVDAILMWPTYTNIGIDDRSQFDYFDAMPGGVEGVRAAIDELHAAGIKVLIPYNPWDAGTLRCGPGQATCGGNANLTVETSKTPNYCDGPATAANPGICDARIIDSLIQNLNADGFNGDTMGKVPEEFYDVSVGLKHSVAIEPEGGGNVVDGPANWDTMGWGYWKYPFVPSVDSWKWQDSRRMTNICERWSKNHTNALQYALFNGDGFESWENVWGTWNGITKQDSVQIRRVGSLLRFLGHRGYLQSEGWEPHYPTLDPSIFASFWPAPTSGAAWTIVNRDLRERTVPLIKVPIVNETMYYFDLYNGVQLKPINNVLTVKIERFGAILSTTTVDQNLTSFLKLMAESTLTPIRDFDPSWDWMRGSRVPVARSEHPTTTADMVRIPGGPFLFKSHGIEIEGSGGTGDPRDFNVNPYGVDFQYEWESQPNRYHWQWLNLSAYWLDKTPVTQSAFYDYLVKNPSAVPDDRYHYLKNWDWSSGSMPKPFPGNDSLPVTYIGLDEARAYCAYLGKRLPHEEEWQFAATGGGDDDRQYPWGNALPNSTYAATQTTGNVFRGPEPVDAHPAGASPFGILDMMGNVWQMTDEYQDERTRSVIVKGGCNYRPSTSMWYFPQTMPNCGNGHCGYPNLGMHNKYFLMNSRYERAGTLGFRCAADIAGLDNIDCQGQPLCGKFTAPNAKVSLNPAGKWVVWTDIDPTKPQSFTAISKAASVSPEGSPLSRCNATQTSFLIPQNKSTTEAICQVNGSTGIYFSVAPTAIGNQTLSIYVGAAPGSTLMITSNLTDNGKTWTYQAYVNASDDRVLGSIAYNVRWDLWFMTKSLNAVLHVTVSAPSVPVPSPSPPPPPPPQPPCNRPMCGNVNSLAGNTILSDVGVSDWTHYGLGDNIASVNKKCSVGGLIHPLQHIQNGGTELPFFNCPQTFSWVDGGYEKGSPSIAQVGSVDSTPTAVYSSASAGSQPGGFAFTVEVPPTTGSIKVYIFIGTCGNVGVFSASLLSGSAVVDSFNYTMDSGDGKTCQWTAVATLQIGPNTSQGSRILSGTWMQDEADAKSNSRNIQFHAIAVDAGAAGGKQPQVPCATPGKTPGGTVVLQAAILS